MPQVYLHTSTQEKLSDQQKKRVAHLNFVLNYRKILLVVKATIHVNTLGSA